MPPSIVIATKLAAMWILLWAWYVALVPNQQHRSFESTEVRDNYTGFVNTITAISHWGILSMFVTNTLLFCLPPNSNSLTRVLWNWNFIRSGLYCQDGRLKAWSWDEVLAVLISYSGLRLRLWAFEVLGKLFTFWVTVKSDHVLVKEGPYALLMHPSYTGALMLVFGFCWFFGMRGWLFWSTLPAITFVLLSARIGNEESVLKEEFGAEFEAYAATRYRLLPFVY